MAKIPETFQFSSREDLTVEELLRIVEDMYLTLARAINQKPDFYERGTDGQSSDTFLSNGTINLNSATQKVEMLTSRPTSSTVGWTQLSP